MSSTETQAAGQQPKKKAPGFSRTKVQRVFPIYVRFASGPLADNAPLKFTFRMQLSKEAMARREKWLGLTQAERNALLQDQILDEVADLLVAEPEGIEDWPEPDTARGDGPGNVGKRLHQYVAEITNEDTKFLMEQILEAASNGYWAAVTPHEFRPKVSDSST
jgi:hypothetical protein